MTHEDKDYFNDNHKDFKEQHDVCHYFLSTSLVQLLVRIRK